eukprot:7291018-Karenia_brevis.AAC.1
MAKGLDRELDRAFQKKHFVQNHSKAIAIAVMHGDGARNGLKDLAGKGLGVTKQARYLGPQLHWRGSASAEIQIR